MSGEEKKFIGGIDFKELRAQRVQVYNELVIDLSVARSNDERVFTGTYVYAVEGTDVDANVDIRFNELFRANIGLVKGRGIRCPFYRFYLTNAAQAGKTITLIIGIESADFEIFDVGKALGITGLVPTVPSPRTGYTQVVASDVAVDATVVLHTVTAGKTFYLIGATLSVALAGLGIGKLTITNAGDVEQYDPLAIGGPDPAAVRFGDNNFHPPIPLEIPAGYKLKLVSSTATISVNGFIQGYEV